MENALSDFGRCVRLPSSRFYPLPVGTHPDTLIGKIGETLFVCDKEDDVKKALRDANVPFLPSDHTSGEKYPHDCGLNFLTLKGKMIGKLDILSESAKLFAKENGYELINIKQGYAKCSCAVIGNTVVTADRKAAKILRNSGIDVLEITPGGVELPPYEYGFIGGACGQVDDKTIMFFGDIGTHPDGEKISALCKKSGVNIIGFDGKLQDLGGFISFSS